MISAGSRARSWPGKENSATEIFSIRMKVTALIPVKGFRNAKQRLSPLLNLHEREKLAELMFREVLSQLLQVRTLVGVAVVTGDEYVAQIASAHDAMVIREPHENGETEAVDFARRNLQQLGCEAVLILPGDMPLLRAADIKQLLAEVPDEPGDRYALLVPSHDRLGTNALLLAPPTVIQLRFGYDSFRFHTSQVEARKLAVRCFENDR